MSVVQSAFNSKLLTKNQMKKESETILTDQQHETVAKTSQIMPPNSTSQSLHCLLTQMSEPTKETHGKLIALLSQILRSAYSDERLIFGMKQSSRTLQAYARDLEGILLCVLPTKAANNVETDICLTLIEAFCYENEVLQIRTDSAFLIKELLIAQDRFEVANLAEECILVKRTNSSISKEKAEEKAVSVLRFHSNDNLVLHIKSAHQISKSMDT